MSSAGVRRPMFAVFTMLASTALLPVAEGLCSPLFSDDVPLDFELRGPLGAVVDAMERRDELDFDLTVTGDAPLGVKVRSRGNSRLKVCDFPPLRLDFPKREVTGTVFEGQNRLKLVTHCNERRRDAGNVFDEYLAYRIFNLVSDASYRVRLVRISYVDTTGEPEPPTTRWGFLIESAEELAARTATAETRLAGVPYSRVDHEHAALVYTFQYLIGNTDWSLVTALTDEYCCHNVDIFSSGERLIAVPYDFDLSGLVDASYARPDRSLPISSVRVRAWRGYCVPRATLSAAMAAIGARESDILQLARDVPAADPATNRERRARYLGEYFEQAAKDVRLVERFERRCL